jgi:hypothetical protein
VKKIGLARIILTIQRESNSKTWSVWRTRLKRMNLSMISDLRLGSMESLQTRGVRRKNLLGRIRLK